MLSNKKTSVIWYVRMNFVTLDQPWTRRKVRPLKSSFKNTDSDNEPSSPRKRIRFVSGTWSGKLEVSWNWVQSVVLSHCPRAYSIRKSLNKMYLHFNFRMKVISQYGNNSFDLLNLWILPFKEEFKKSFIFESRRILLISKKLFCCSWFKHRICILLWTSRMITKIWFSDDHWFRSEKITETWNEF